MPASRSERRDRLRTAASRSRRSRCSPSWAREERAAPRDAGDRRLVGELKVGGCPWDINGNGSVETVDLDLLSQWGAPGSADLDGTVAVTDLLALLADWD